MNPALSRADTVALDVGALFDAHAEELCRFVHRMTGSREVAEEVVQEVFVTAWRRRLEIEGIDNPRGWLYRVALNHLRHRRRSFARFANFLDRWRARSEPGAAGPDARLDERERAERVHAAIRQLSPVQREVFVLFELQEVSGAEIADILGIKPNTVWGRLRLARERFRAILGEEEP